MANFSRERTYKTLKLKKLYYIKNLELQKMEVIFMQTLENQFISNIDLLPFQTNNFYLKYFYLTGSIFDIFRCFIYFK